jgi:hypothetical protein
MHRSVIASLGWFVVTASLAAQAPTLATTQTTVSACTYATCALRLENGGFAGPRIRAGLEGVSRRVGFTGNGIVDAVRDVPAALTEAHLGHSHQVRSRVIGLVSTSAAFAWIFIAAQSNRYTTRQASIYGGVSLGLIGGIFSAAQLAQADQRFSRAVWLYNQTLPH